MEYQIDYLHRDDNPPLDGWECPTCHKKSWWVLKCNKCGEIFCKHCKPEYFKCNAWHKQNPIFKDNEFDEETAEFDTCVDVHCKCGASILFYD